MGRKRKPTRILFDENSRREFVTGFHKRKVERRKKFEEKLEQELKEAKKRIKSKAREITRKITSSYEEGKGFTSPIFQKSYELPEHTVHVREFLADDIAQENHWIGENKIRYEAEAEPEIECDAEDQSRLDVNVAGMQLNSMKALKKVVSKQSIAMMQRDSTFRKKNKIERVKNKKRAARKKKLLAKDRKKKSGKRKR